MYQQPISLFISLRYLWNQNFSPCKKFITIVSIISVSISISVLIIMLSLFNGFQEEFLKNVLSFIPHVIITNKNKNVNQSQFPKKILSMKGIEKISNFIHHEVILKFHSHMMMGEIIGIDIHNYTDVNQYDVKNILYKLKNNTKNVVIGIKLAKKLNIRLGNKIRLMVFSSKKNAIMKNSVNSNLYNVVGFFYSHNEVDYYQILMNQTDAAHLLNYSKNYITGWRLWLKDPLSINIDKMKKFVYPLIISDWKHDRSEFCKAIEIEKSMMILLFILVFLIISGNIITNLMLSITEKNHSIAILKSQGLSNWNIMLVFIILGSSTTMIGVLLGILISVVLIIQKTFILYIIKIFFKDVQISIIVQTYQIFLISNISLLYSILLSLYPAWTTIKLKTENILSKNE